MKTNISNVLKTMKANNKFFGERLSLITLTVSNIQHEKRQVI